jgi:hypothetical protein
MRSFFWAMTAIALGQRAAAAQPADTTRQRNYAGLSAGALVSSVWVAFEHEASSGRWGGRLDFGYRIRSLCLEWAPILCWQRSAALAPLRLTPHLSLFATDVRGMDVDRDKYAYAVVDKGLRVSYALPGTRELRPYFDVMSGKRTAERRAPAPLVRRVWNYTGGGSALGIGLEIPVARSGRGLDVGVTWIRGRFTQYEFLKADSAADVRHRAVAVHVGWSGPFSGISLPWQ